MLASVGSSREEAADAEYEAGGEDTHDSLIEFKRFWGAELEYGGQNGAFRSQSKNQAQAWSKAPSTQRLHEPRRFSQIAEDHLEAQAWSQKLKQASCIKLTPKTMEIIKKEFLKKQVGTMLVPPSQVTQKYEAVINKEALEKKITAQRVIGEVASEIPARSVIKPI